MKIQNFYPRQVARRLSGRHIDSLSDGERRAVEYFFLNSRRLGLPLAVTAGVLTLLERK